MNIIAQSCGVILLLILIYFYNKNKRLKLYTEKAFLKLLFVSLITLIMDISSIVAIVYAEHLPTGMWQVICKAYLISLNWTMYTGNRYVCVELYKVEKIYKKMIRSIRALFLIGALLIAVLPISYQYKETYQIYTEGPSVLATYLLALLLIFAILYQIRSYNTMLNGRRLHAITVWVGLWFVAAIVQFFNNQLLLVGFSIALANMIIYLVVENPEASIDRETGLFNQTGLRLYMKQMYERGISFSMMSITFRYAESSETLVEITPKDQKEILAFFVSIKDAFVFTTIENEVILIYANQKALEDGIQNIQERFDGCLCGVEVSQNCRRLELRYVIAEDSSIAKTEDMLLAYFQHCRQDMSKKLQGNFIYIDEKCIQDIEREKKITRMLERAIAENRVEVFYQPIYSMKERCFTSAEALARIRDEEGNLIPPGLFIQIAEKTGMIVRLGQRIFEQVCAFIQSEEYKKLGLSYIEVNLSMIQCGYEFLARDYIEIMEQYHVLPKHINLEITESASMKAKQILLENMRQLKEYGVTFSLDDFGTGQSNLNYIAEMPVDIVKFDKDMTQAYFTDEKVRYVVKTAMEMIQGMGMKIVSEGIEEKGQFETMEQLQIDYIQGYYFSKPLPQMEFCEFIQGV